MTPSYFYSTVRPIITTRFRSSSWAADVSKRGFYARWYIALLDKYASHKYSFEEVDAAVSHEYAKEDNYSGQLGYYLALTRTKYYKYKLIHTRIPK